jgi:hypothetical protein
MLEDVKRLAGFASDVLVQRNPLDRPDITYNIQRVQYPLKSYRDLEFVIAAAEEPERTPADLLAGRLVDGLTEWSTGGTVNQGKIDTIREAIKAGDLVAAKEMIRKDDLAAIAVQNSSAARNKGHGDRARQEIEKGDRLYSRSRCCRIPKTIIYMDTIAHIQEAAALLTLRLIRMGCSKTSAVKAITVYHSELAEFDKEAVSTEFCKPDVEDCRACSSYRIVLATDAMGMGINNPDIQRIVQWRLPPSMCSLLQRAGRAARRPDVWGELIWLVEPWCFGPKAQHIRWVPDSQPLLPSQSSEETQFEESKSSDSEPDCSRSQSSKAMTDAVRRSRMPRGIWQLINRNTCIRRGILEFFGEDITHYRGFADPCCSICSDLKLPSLAPSLAFVHSVPQSPPWIKNSVQMALRKWREEKAQEVLSPTLLSDPKYLLSDATIRDVSLAANSIHTTQILRRITGGKWAFFAEYKDEILGIIKSACSIAVPHRASVRKRVARHSARPPLQESPANAQPRLSASQPRSRARRGKRRRW